jgi:hypothetical protein
MCQPLKRILMLRIKHQCRSRRSSNRFSVN